jgi:hypothetical protein
LAYAPGGVTAFTQSSRAMYLFQQIQLKPPPCPSADIALIEKTRSAYRFRCDAVVTSESYPLSNAGCRRLTAPIDWANTKTRFVKETTMNKLYLSESLRSHNTKETN